MTTNEGPTAVGAAAPRYDGDDRALELALALAAAHVPFDDVPSGFYVVPDTAVETVLVALDHIRRQNEDTYCPCGGQCHHDPNPCSFSCLNATQRAFSAALAASAQPTPGAARQPEETT